MNYYFLFNKCLLTYDNSGHVTACHKYVGPKSTEYE